MPKSPKSLFPDLESWKPQDLMASTQLQELIFLMVKGNRKITRREIRENLEAIWPQDQSPPSIGTIGSILKSLGLASLYERFLLFGPTPEYHETITPTGKRIFIRETQKVESLRPLGPAEISRRVAKSKRGNPQWSLTTKTKVQPARILEPPGEKTQGPKGKRLTPEEKEAIFSKLETLASQGIRITVSLISQEFSFSQAKAWRLYREFQGKETSHPNLNSLRLAPNGQILKTQEKIPKREWKPLDSSSPKRRVSRPKEES